MDDGEESDDSVWSGDCEDIRVKEELKLAKAGKLANKSWNKSLKSLESLSLLAILSRIRCLIWLNNSQSDKQAEGKEPRRQFLCYDCSWMGNNMQTTYSLA